MSPRRVLCAALAVALLAACSSAPAHQPPAPGGSSAAAAEPSAWEQVLGQVGRDGHVSVYTALAAFSLAVGPVPGVVTPAGRHDPIGSGTLAINWALSHWSELTGPQRSAVLAALGATPAGNAPAAFASTRRRPLLPARPPTRTSAA